MAIVIVTVSSCGIDHQGSAPAAGGTSGGGAGTAGTSTDGGVWPDGSGGGSGGSSATGGAAGSGGSAAGSGGAAGSAGAAGSGGTGATGNENCANGKDDDGDKLVDCADPDCVAYSCYVVPPGFTGPVAVYLGPDPAPTCDTAAGYPNEAQAGGTIQAAPAVCPTCGCDPAGVTCGDPTAHSYGSNNCSGPEITNHAFTGCQGFQGGTANSYKLNTPAPGGSCSATSSGSPNVPPVAYSPAARVCAAASLGTGCAGGAKCAKKSSGAFGSICFYKDGALASCPAPYTQLTVMDVGVKSDTRDCSACTCTKGCDTTATATDNFDCSGTPYGKLTADNTCGPVQGQTLFGVTATVTNTCSFDGGQPKGNVTTNQITLCCLP